MGLDLLTVSMYALVLPPGFKRKSFAGRRTYVRERDLIDFHTHSFLSDGALVPSELVRRAAARGYRAIGITDHVDYSNLEDLCASIIRVARELNRAQEVFVIPGVEITHAPPSQIPELVLLARELGAGIVVAHGESPVEPVAKGTNLAAIEAGADILAHPGFISESEAELAAHNGTFLEITARAGHNMTNGHVARIAFSRGAKLIVGTDCHSPSDLIDRSQAIKVLIGAGLDLQQARDTYSNNEALLARMRDQIAQTGI
jgi:histidinol phosphatase-like PHP family hydrolase